MKKYDVWVEGFVITGNRAGHSFVGASEGENFDDACKRLSETKPDLGMEKRGDTWVIWGCRLFDNSSDAAKAFG